MHLESFATLISYTCIIFKKIYSHKTIRTQKKMQKYLKKSIFKDYAFLQNVILIG